MIGMVWQVGPCLTQQWCPKTYSLIKDYVIQGYVKQGPSVFEL